jgi:4-amino-4-deoxy-L-arabinose transferase-like glycosyltransferase
MTNRRALGLVSLVILGAMTLRAALIVLDAVPFNADEAVVALMARHILQGERPWFFYGQAYMGSLDAYLVAGAFRIFGEHVWAIRLVQTALYAAFLATSYAVALRFTADRRTALVATAVLAIPPVLLVLYTTASLGGYGEALVAGNLLLWWGHRLGSNAGKRWCMWLGWGLVAGLGFWSLGLVLVYVVPIAVWLVWRLRGRAWRGYLLATLGFVFGSLPWWLGNRGRVDIGVAELLGTAVRSSATAGSVLGNITARIFNFVVLGLPALLGLRFPWSVEGPPMWLAVPALALYLGAVLHSVRLSFPRSSTAHSSPTRLPLPPPASRSTHRILWGICTTLFLGFVLTPFGGDPSGRYFLPLYVPLAIFTAEALTALRARTRSWAWVLLGAVLAFNLIGTVQAASTNPPGITTQFETITQVDHRYDDELIDFLRAHGGTRGYANYWVAYPIAFLSKEKIILVPRLPYKADLRYTARDDRYAPYEAQVETSPTVVYVTTNHSSLDELLREQLTAIDVDFHEEQIGDYHVFYDLSRKVIPEELAFPVKE